MMMQNVLYFNVVQRNRRCCGLRTGFCQRTHKLTQPMCNRAKLNTDSNTQGAGDSGAAIEETETANCALDESISPRPRKRTGMSLQEYMTKAHADASRFTL